VSYSTGDPRPLNSFSGGKINLATAKEKHGIEKMRVCLMIGGASHLDTKARKDRGKETLKDEQCGMLNR
jgi:hypothetical protein